MMKPTQATIDRMSLIALLIGSVILAVSIGLFAVAGSYTRYWADDYCYSAWVKQMGLVGGIADWYQTSGNRLTTLVAVAASEVFGPQAIRLVPLAMLLIWVAAWIFFLSRLKRFTGWNTPFVALVWLALVEVFFAVLVAPDRMQTLYWRMGTFHYTLPLPLLLLNLGLILGGLRQTGKASIWLPLASGLLALFAAGLSETFAALQAGLLSMLMLAVWFARRGAHQARARGLLLTAAPLAGTLLMMAVMLSAPANEWRQAAMPPPDNLLLIIPTTLRYALDFIFFTVRGRIAPFGVYCIGIAAGTILFHRPDAQHSPRRLLVGAVVCLVVTYLLIAASFAPSALGDLQYPAGRAQMPAAFVLLVGMGIMAVLFAEIGRSLLPARGRVWWLTVALLALVAFSLYPLRVTGQAEQDRAALAVRAERWDERDAQIHSALANGSRDVQVRQTDVVQGLEDYGPDPTNWINTCAAMYYGAGSITANP